MEEQRIGMMYLNLLRLWLSKIWDSLFPRGLRRSSALPIMVICGLLLVPAIGWYLHIHGRFHKVKREIKGEPQNSVVAQPRPGGADPIFLKRTESAGSSLPEFLSVTLLPGLGMGVLQITASVPNHGEVPLLSAPTVAALENDTGPRIGVNDVHGALEVPWSGPLNGPISPLGTSLTTSWRTHAISVPRDSQERSGVGAEGGLLMVQAADTTRVSPDGALIAATGEFKGTDFDGHWLSKTDVSATATLGPRAIDLIVTVKNVGDQAEPMGVGWHPRFVFPSSNRVGVELRLPNGDVLAYSDRGKSSPSGRIAASTGPISQFQGHTVPLGNAVLDETLVHLKPALMDAGIAVELRDPSSSFGLRLTAASSSIRALRISAPAGADYISIGMQTNFDDPTGKEWTGEDVPIAVLQPGQAMEWKVRLEIFPIMKR